MIKLWNKYEDLRWHECKYVYSISIVVNKKALVKFLNGNWKTILVDQIYILLYTGDSHANN